MDEFKQQHLINGVTHWIAWMTQDQVNHLAKSGWKVHKTWTLTLARNKDGVLVPLDSLSLK